jgi:hypothetical protein
MSDEMGTAGIGYQVAAAVLALLLALAAALPASAHRPTASLAAIEVFDRQEGTTLPVYARDGRRYVVGTPGHEYTVRVRNLTGERILAVTSVDGVNVISGETAAPRQSGYVIDPYGSVDIAGWRKSLSRTAAFYFTDLGDSYAARTGRPGNVGVIGVAVFRERPRPLVYRPQEKIGRAEAEADVAPPVAAHAGASPPVTAQADGAAPVPAQAMPAPPASEPPRDRAANAGFAERSAKSLGSPLGTGHGRNETSYATRVSFERASASPAQLVTINYDRRENLVAMGVLPGPYLAHRSPDPFPGGGRFVPDPR